MHAVALLTSGSRILKSNRPMRIVAASFCIRPINNKVPLLLSLPKISFLTRINKLHTTLRNNATKYKWNYFWQSQETEGNTKYYCVGLVFIMTGLSFAFIPFYQMLCEQTSFTGLAQVATDLERIVNMEKVEDRLIRVQFNADVPSSMQWKFKPLQDEIYVHPGETALAFFTATNPTNKPIVGISTYNLMPFQSAYYFNKIQCFCFDEQILNPGEEVDLPVFFYIDPDFVNDPLLENLDEILLSYTFFESGTVKNLPSPFDPNNRPKTFPKAVEESSNNNEDRNITKKALKEQFGAEKAEMAKNIIQQ